MSLDSLESYPPALGDLRTKNSLRLMRMLGSISTKKSLSRVLWTGNLEFRPKTYKFTLIFVFGGPPIRLHSISESISLQHSMICQLLRNPIFLVPFILCSSPPQLRELSGVFWNPHSKDSVDF